jgi:hypothetical protein
MQRTTDSSAPDRSCAATAIRAALRSPAVALEALVAAGLVGLALVRFVLHAHAMATTGLWTDEIASVRDFRSAGLWTSLTHYPVPNNHIFFNALNSLIDWPDPYAPLAARGLSLTAMASVFSIGVIFLALRRSFLEAGLFAHLLFMNPELVDLGLQARGYGLLALLTLALSLFARDHVRHPERARGSLGMATAAVLGIWTVPTFVLFALPVMAFSLLRSWHARVLRARDLGIAVGSAAVTLLVHWPVADQMIEIQRIYARDWGTQFGSIDAVFEGLREYLLHEGTLVLGPNDTAIALWCVAVCALVFAPHRRDALGPPDRPDEPPGVRERRIRSRLGAAPLPAELDADQAAARVLLGGVIGSIVLALLLETPPVRTIAPLVVAIVFAACLALGTKLPPIECRRARAWAALVLGLVLLPHDDRQVERFGFTPMESHLDVARFIDRALPGESAIAVPFRPDDLAVYLRKPHRFAPGLAPAPAAVVHNGIDPDPAIASLVRDPRYVAIRFPQRRAGHQTLYVAPPADRAIHSISLVPRFRGESWLDATPAYDGDVQTALRVRRPLDWAPSRFELEIGFEPGRLLYSLVALLDPDVKLKRMRAEVRFDDGTLEPIPDDRIAFQSGALVVELGFETGPSDAKSGRAITGLLLRLRPEPKPRERLLVIREVWCQALDASAAGQARTGASARTSVPPAPLAPRRLEASVAQRQ